MRAGIRPAHLVGAGQRGAKRGRRFGDLVRRRHRRTVIGTMVWSAVPAVIYAMRYSRSESVWSFIYGLYSIPCLSWICVYSIFTVQNSKWMTRGAAVKQSVLTVTQSISVAPICDRAA